MINSNRLADRLKRHIQEETGNKINLPVCEKILSKVFEDIGEFLTYGNKVSLFPIGTLKIELKKSMRIAGNLPGQEGKSYERPEEVRVYFVANQPLKESINKSYKNQEEND